MEGRGEEIYYIVMRKGKMETRQIDGFGEGCNRRAVSNGERGKIGRKPKIKLYANDGDGNTNVVSCLWRIMCKSVWSIHKNVRGRERI